MRKLDGRRGSPFIRIAVPDLGPLWTAAFGEDMLACARSEGARQGSSSVRSGTAASTPICYPGRDEEQPRCYSLLRLESSGHSTSYMERRHRCMSGGSISDEVRRYSREHASADQISEVTFKGSCPQQSRYPVRFPIDLDGADYKAVMPTPVLLQPRKLIESIASLY